MNYFIFIIHYFANEAGPIKKNLFAIRQTKKYFQEKYLYMFSSTVSKIQQPDTSPRQKNIFLLDAKYTYFYGTIGNENIISMLS
mmetsp:Transcript_10839/g.12142  ORF Transcript_10839/g.12142 Transcript_10839/m.12142 type:complete len:84 (-) Transcript_10839:1089-1340(-)